MDGSVASMGVPLSVTRTNLAPIADKGSSFLLLIQAYMSLLNFVVISTRGKHLLILIQVYTKWSILMNLTLTLFSFNIYGGRREMGPDLGNRTQGSADLQDRPNFQLS